MGGWLALAALAALPLRAERISSDDQVLTLRVPEDWRKVAPASEPNVVLEAKRSDGATLRVAPAPFPPGVGGLEARARAWAAQLLEKGYILPAKPSRMAAGEGLTLFLFPLEVRGPPSLHGFFETPHGSYYLRTHKLERRELAELLSGLEVRARRPRPFESLWPSVALKNVLSQDGTFIVQVPEAWVSEEGPTLGPQQVISLRAGETLVTVSPTPVPAQAEPIKSAVQATLEGALQEGAQGGPPDFLVLPNGLVLHFVQVAWPKFKTPFKQVAGFFALGSRTYSVAAVNLPLQAVRELVGSVGPPPEEMREEAAAKAEAWTRPRATPKPLPSLPGASAEPTPPRKRAPLPAWTFEALLLASAMLAGLGGWLYVSESMAERSSEVSAAEAGAEGPDQAPPPPPPENGPLWVKRRYFTAQVAYEVSGPEGLRFIAESRRPLWLLRWMNILAYVNLWVWSLLLGTEGWASIQFLKIATFSTAFLSLPAEILFGRRIRLMDARGRVLLQARRDGLSATEEYRVLDPEGREIARLVRKLGDRFEQKRWTVLTPGPEKAPVLVLEGEWRPNFRKIAGHLFGLLRDDIVLRLPEGGEIGRSYRQGSPLDRGVVEYPPETASFITSDVLALALATVHILDPDRPHPWFLA